MPILEEIEEEVEVEIEDAIGLDRALEVMIEEEGPTRDDCQDSHEDNESQDVQARIIRVLCYNPRTA